jgi:hypothetical protein
MDKKVTRRVALGTVAVGLGSAVAAPYIISALKGRYKANLPVGGRYEKEWESVVKTFDLPIKEISGPETFTLDYKPQVGTKSRVVSLDASYETVSDSLIYPQPPHHYYLSEGSISSISPIIDSLPAILIKAEKMISSDRTLHKDKRGCESILVPTKGEIAFYEREGGVPKMIPLAKVNSSCYNLGTSIIFYYPIEKTLAIGSKWTTPITIVRSVELPCEIVGFNMIAGRETVKMVADKHLNNQEVQQYTKLQFQQIQEIDKQRGNKYNIDQELKANLQKVVAEKTTMAFSVIAYVDIKTGLVIRQENKCATHSLKVASNQTSISISQVIES